MIEVCKTCAAALAMGRPEVAKQLIVPVPVTALTRYFTRSGIIELAVNTFNADMFRSICQLEQMFMKLESESRFKYVFLKDHGNYLIFGVVICHIPSSW